LDEIKFCNGGIVLMRDGDGMIGSGCKIKFVAGFDDEAIKSELDETFFLTLLVDFELDFFLLCLAISK
jgi:hypothetical protein